MPVLFNIRHLEEKTLFLKGELPAVELDLDEVDELIHLPGPLTYDLEVQKIEKGILVQGSLQLTLECECARCLKPSQHPLSLQEWACHLPLEGEDRVVLRGDFVDLTPYIREDILLALSQHPLCEPECKGLAGQNRPGVMRKSESASAAWDELNKLKFK